MRSLSLIVKGNVRVVWKVGGATAFPAMLSASTMRLTEARTLVRVAGLVVRMSIARRAESITMFSASPAWIEAQVTTAVS